MATINKSIADIAREIVIDLLLVDDHEVTLDAHFNNDLGADSIDKVELCMNFEDRFKISIPCWEVRKIQTFGQAVEYIEGKVKLNQ